MPQPLPQAAGAVDTCRPRVNSFGSTYWAFLADAELVAGMARAEMQKSFRRVILDPARGLVLLMSPARAHERASEVAGDVIKAVASLLGVPTVSLRSTRWRRRADPPNTGPEADCCFYVGDRAKAYLAAEASGEADAERFVLDHPPDIVVEVGVTHVDAHKLRVYQDRGVPEYWEVDRAWMDAAPTVRFISLASPGAPRPLDASNLLPGVTPTLFQDALQSAAREFDGQAAVEVVRDAMVRHGAIRSGT